MRRPLSCAILAAGLLIPAAAAGPTAAHRVPYRLTDTQHLLVRARVNGKGPFHFIVDTGAPAVYLSPAAAKQAGLIVDPDGWAPVPRLELEGGIVLEKETARIEEPPQLSGMNAMGLAGTRLDGILGYNVLSRFRMEIDLSQSFMRWTPVAYEPLPLLTLREMGAKSPPPVANANMLQIVSRLASLLFARAPEGPPALRGFLGFEAREEADGVRVGTVLGGSPAAGAGLRAGDRMLRAGSGTASPTSIKTMGELAKAVASLEPEQELVLEIERAGKPLRLSLRAVKGAF